MANSKGEKELVIEVLEHRKPNKIAFAEMHINNGFIEKFTRRKYSGPKDEIDFSLEIGRAVSIA